MLTSVLQLVRCFWNSELVNTRSITESEFLLVGWQSLTHMFCLVSIFSISSPALFDFVFLHSWLLTNRSPAIISGVSILLLSSIFEHNFSIGSCLSGGMYGDKRHNLVPLSVIMLTATDSYSELS